MVQIMKLILHAPKILNIIGDIKLLLFVSLLYFILIALSALSTISRSITIERVIQKKSSEKKNIQNIKILRAATITKV